MKNKLTILMISLILLVFGLGCGITDKVQKAVGSDNSAANSNKTLTDKAVDITVGEEKIGVPECDQIIADIKAQADNAEDDYVTKAAKQFAINKITESLKKSLVENKNNPTQLAKDCRDFRAQMDKFKSEEQQKKQK
ncbi:MAG: hypothetical protein LUM44_05915 [Pyrinomonadaceae bacterium]|nr:hypothetical protein [Pyrinomonadaceae bacterium]